MLFKVDILYYVYPTVVWYWKTRWCHKTILRYNYTTNILHSTTVQPICICPMKFNYKQLDYSKQNIINFNVLTTRRIFLLCIIFFNRLTHPSSSTHATCVLCVISKCSFIRARHTAIQPAILRSQQLISRLYILSRHVHHIRNKMVSLIRCH